MSNFKYILPLFYIAVTLWSIPSYSQDVKDTLNYSLDLNFSGRRISGTFNQVVAGGAINMDLLYKYWHFENKTSYRYNKTNARLIEDNWYDLATIKYYPKGNKKLYPGIFYHYDNSLMYKVRNRHQYGLGLGSEFDYKFTKLSILAAIAQEHSNFDGSTFVNSDRDLAIRKNGLFLFKLNNSYAFANKKVNLNYQLFYFQSLIERPDYDIWITTRISFKLIKNLSLFMVYDYRFENVHLESLSNYNDIVLFGIQLKIE